MKRMPQVDQLLTTYHLSGDAAFFLARPMYAHTIQVRSAGLFQTLAAVHPLSIRVTVGMCVFTLVQV